MSKTKKFNEKPQENCNDKDQELNTKSLANIQPPPSPATSGNARSLKHGAFSENYLSPLVEKKEKEIVTLLGEVSYITTIDSIVVRNLARCLSRLERFDCYLDEVNEVIGSGSKQKLNPVISAYFTALETARRHCEALGLSPSSRAKLGVDLVRYSDIAERLAERQK